LSCGGSHTGISVIQKKVFTGCKSVIDFLLLPAKIIFRMPAEPFLKDLKKILYGDTSVITNP
jgi:hypothetical protein